MAHARRSTIDPGTAHAQRGVAIIGMSGRFPGAPTLDAFWQNLRNGVESLETFSDATMAAAGVDDAQRTQPGWVNRGTVLDGADLFDASFFGYSPREAQVIDPQHRIFLECAWEAMEHAGYAGEPPGRSVAVYGTASMNTYWMNQLLANRELVESVGDYQLMIGNDKDFLATRASYKLNLHGPSMTVQTACSSSLVTVHLAVQALLRGECDMALAGGVSVLFPQDTGYLYQEGMIFSPDGTCRPFDAAALGTRGGAGAGIVLLKRLDAAIADGDTIHAIIRGSAINNDGAGKAGYSAPSVDGQMEVIAMAQAVAGVSPTQIGYVEAHGTGTPLGDPIEIAALTRVFRDATDARGFCALGALKANIGHLDVAAGIAGLIKATLVLQHRELPPVVHFSQANPALALDASPFRVPMDFEPWISDGTPRVAGVSAFGIGGTNAHLILEEAPPLPARSVRQSPELLIVSARSDAALDAATARLVSHLRTTDAAPLGDIAHTLQVGRHAFAHRRSVVVRDAAQAVTLLDTPQRAPVIGGVHDGASRPVAFLFSGQGSQHAGMCAALYADEPVFRDAVDRCADRLQTELGADVRTMIAHATDAELSETRLAQPMLFVTEYALAMLWMSWGVEPAAMLGHSIGEYVAAYLAGVFTLDDALHVVAARGRLMQALAPGAMLAVRLSPTEVASRLPAGVEIAAINAPAFCTVSGPATAIAALQADLELAGIEQRALHTSHAFHSAMMDPALAPFRDVFASVTLSPPTRPFVSNVTGTWITDAEATSPDYWVAHLRGTVRFADGIAALLADPAMQLLEVGPGNALTSLARQSLGRAAAGRAVQSLPHPREDRSDVESLLGAAGRLWTSGVTIAWDSVRSHRAARRVPLPTYPFERKRHWVDAAVSPSVSVAEIAPVDETRHDRVDDWFYTPTWSRAPLAHSRHTVPRGTWLVFARADELSARVLDALDACGARGIRVEQGTAFAALSDQSYMVRATTSDDYDAVLSAVQAQGTAIAGIIHLWNVGSSTTSSVTTSVHALAALSWALLRSASLTPIRLVVATSDAQSVLGEDIAEPARAMIAGAVMVLPVEHEYVHASAIDLDQRAGIGAAVDALLREAGTADASSFVAQRVGQRFIRRVEPTPLPPLAEDALPLTPQGVYLLTGGLGGIGATLAQWLATQCGARLILTARTPLPPRAEWDAWLGAHDVADETAQRIERVRQVEACGGAVRVIAAEVSDLAAMRDEIAVVEAEWGPVNGIVHAAGVPSAGLLGLITDTDIDAALDAKVNGLNVLVSLFGERQLDFVVLCSSINAVLGNPGAFAYTAANAWLDAFAVSTHRPAGWPVTSIAWDAWNTVGMATKVVVPPAMRAAREAIMRNGIRPADGADAFARALASRLPLHVVSPWTVTAWRDMRSGVPSSAARIGGPSASDRDMAAVGGGAARTAAASASTLEASLMAIWRELLGEDDIGIDDNFFELGGHSLLATRVLARVTAAHGVRLTLRTMFEAPTVRQFAVLVAAQQVPVPALADGADGSREEFEL